MNPKRKRKPKPKPSYIKDLRCQLGLKQVELADRLGVDQTTISKWEQGGAISRVARRALELFLEKA